MKISEESYEEQKRILEEQQKKLERKFIRWNNRSNRSIYLKI